MQSMYSSPQLFYKWHISSTLHSLVRRILDYGFLKSQTPPYFFMWKPLKVCSINDLVYREMSLLQIWFIIITVPSNFCAFLPAKKEKICNVINTYRRYIVTKTWENFWNLLTLLILWILQKVHIHIHNVLQLIPSTCLVWSVDVTKYLFCQFGYKNRYFCFMAPP